MKRAEVESNYLLIPFRFNSKVVCNSEEKVIYPFMINSDIQIVKILRHSFEQFVCEESIPRIIRCLSMLDFDQLWNHPHRTGNSIGHLILHLEGNARQYILSGIGGEQDCRQRMEEFRSTDYLSREELVLRLETLSKTMKQVLMALQPEDLIKEKEVQIYQMSVLKMVLHVMEHFSYHTGQIVFYTKMMTGVDMRFYDDSQLNSL